MINNKRMINDFIEMVKIPSPSRDERKICDYIKNELSNMNVEFYEDECGKLINGNSGNIIAYIKGDIDKNVLLSAHMDTVTPCEVINPIIDDVKISSDKTSVLGADDKAGISIILESIKVLRENNIKHPNLLVVFSVAEEAGLLGAKNIDLSKFGKIDYGYILDAGGSPGICYNKSPYSVNAKFRIIGKEAHAGTEPENGINAFVVASDAISKVKIGRIDFETTCNIGIVSGGVASNVVMPSLDIDFEARSLDELKLNNVVDNVINELKDSCNKYNAVLEYEINKGIPGFTLDESSYTIQLLKESAKELGFEFSSVASGGGSDTNIYNLLGIESINIGIGMANVHTKEEYIMIEDLINGAKLLVEVLKNVK